LLSSFLSSFHLNSTRFYLHYEEAMPKKKFLKKKKTQNVIVLDGPRVWHEAKRQNT